MIALPIPSPDEPAPAPEERPEGLRIVGGGDTNEAENPGFARGHAGPRRKARQRPASRPQNNPRVHYEFIDDPHGLAHEVLASYTRRAGWSLVHFRDQFFVYDGSAYRACPTFDSVELIHKVKAAVDSRFDAALAAQQAQATGSNPSEDEGWGARRPTRPRVTTTLRKNVEQALISMVAVNGELDAPFWLGSRPNDPDPTNIVAVENGLLDLGGDHPILIPHTPRFFSPGILPYSYAPDAPRPEGWLRFLADVWADDPESVDCLHEVMGYLLAGDNRLHKLFLLIGPPRSGKSTILNVITALIGQRNVASCSANSLGGEFGLQPLLGKSLAIMADARMGSTSPVMLDRLVRITGGDAVEVNRKNREILVNVNIKTRFVIVSNELPDLRDASKAITSRYVLLRTSKSVPAERQDLDLSSRLAAEQSGILNLAIEGRARLLARGRFRQPSSGADLLADAEDLASPVAEFVRECYDLDACGTVGKAEFFKDWEGWAQKQGYKATDVATLGKNLRAAFPTITTSRPRESGKQVASYVGLRRRSG